MEFANDEQLMKMFKATSFSSDPKGEDFVTTIEGLDYPFYGTQFHPEKQYLSFAPGFDFKHDEQSEVINRKFADFFVGETRKNTNGFMIYEQEVIQLIENFDLVVTEDYLGANYVFK